MAVFRVPKIENFTMMSNHHLRNKKLSLKAVGLMSKILSLPDEWDYSLKGLIFSSFAVVLILVQSSGLIKAS